MQVISAERFAQGQTWAQYLATCQQLAAERQANYQQVTFTAKQAEQLAALRAQGLKVLVLEEDWCGDAAKSGPVLARLAEAAGLEARWFRRDQNLDIMDRFLEGGSRAIPVFLFMDPGYRLLARWGSRPRHVAAVRERYLPALPPKDDPAYAEALKPLYRAMQAAYLENYPGAIVNELLELLKEA